MSQTFTLSGYSSTLSTNYYPPIELETNSQYCIGLIGLQTYNTIPNIEEGNNTFHYDSNKKIILPTGSYEIGDIEKYIQNELSSTLESINKARNSVEKETDLDKLLSLKANNNTLHSELKSIYSTDFTKENSIGKLLGFSSKILKANVKHNSDLPVQITRVTSIRVECNIVTGSYYNNHPSHTLFEWAVNVSPGYKISIEPRNIYYLPLNSTSAIENIRLDIVDQEGRHINFRGEEILVRLELRKLSNGSHI